jgi:hypothetical protein
LAYGLIQGPDDVHDVLVEVIIHIIILDITGLVGNLAVTFEVDHILAPSLADHMVDFHTFIGEVNRNLAALVAVHKLVEFVVIRNLDT